MSGHNKFSKIKHKKAATDAKKSKIFSMYARLITIASKEAGGDVSSASLRTVIDKAKRANMPNDNIDRAVKKGVETGGDAFSELTFETYGPGGVGVVISGITDNNNRTSQEIKHLLSKNGYTLATPGSVTWAFTSSRDEEGTKWEATSTVTISDEDKEKLAKLLDTLDEHEDIKQVFSNEA